jgi:hypothetical protein
MCGCAFSSSPRPLLAARSIILAKPAVVRTTRAEKYEGRGIALAMWLAHRSLFVALHGMGARSSALDPPNVDDSPVEVDLIPAQVADVCVREGDQDHRRITMAAPIRLGDLDQNLDLAGREVLAGAKLGVRTSGWRNCS